MPLYEYRCQCCGTRFEQLVRRRLSVPKAIAGSSPATPEPTIICPDCHSTAVSRVFSAFASPVAGVAAPGGGG